MDAAVVCELVSRVVAVDESTATRDALTSAGDQIRQLQAWLQGQQIRITRGLTRVASFPEDAVARAGHVSLTQAGRLVERSETAAMVPALGAAVAAGRVAGEHIDAVTRAMRNVEPTQRPRLAARADALVAVAAEQTPDEFARRLRSEVRRLSSDDGVDRLHRQRCQTRLATFTEPDTGMWRLSGAYDPLTGVTLQRVLDTAVNRLFAEQTPDTCPADPIARQDYLRALALADLLTNGGVRLTAPEAVLVIHAAQSGETVIDLGGDVELPRRALDDLVSRASLHPVVVRDGEVVWAPGPLDLGRSQRLASCHQRRALHALYRSCAVPGCGAAFHRSKIHHIVPWELAGATDLRNLIPLCPHHHARVHTERWQLRLEPGRVLVIDLPDGTQLRGPPNRAGP